MRVWLMMVQSLAVRVLRTPSFTRSAVRVSVPFFAAVWALLSGKGSRTAAKHSHARATHQAASQT